MIDIIGTEGTSEYATALMIKNALIALWPGIEKTPAEEELIHIAAAVKISGYPVADIDVVVAGKFGPARKFVPKKVLRDKNGARVTGAISVSSIVAALEVKDHDPSKTRITGDAVEVRYGRAGASGWKNATEQNIKQVHSLCAYFADHDASVFVNRLLVMRGFSKPPCAGAIGNAFSGADFLTGLLETSPVPASLKLQATINSSQLANVLSAPIFQVLKPTSLDRGKMDRIAARSAELDPYLDLLGTKMLRFRGRGGTGKTVMLLQLAWRAFSDLGRRSLLLTYNHALASDIKRLMALMGIPADDPDGGVTVRTVMSFVYAWLSRLGLIDPLSDWDDDKYQTLCADALVMLREGAISKNDIARLKSEDPDSFDFDHLIIDEAQDWPRAEIEFLKQVYGPEHLCLADGVDQLIRGKQANWDDNVPEASRRTIPLNTCLRMKAGLSLFMNAVADEANLNWRVQPNPHAGGGRVFVVLGPMLGQKALIRELLLDSEKAGNSPIDNLFCVPPTDVVTGQDAKRSSRLAGILKQWGYEIWDGTNERLRKDFPRNPNSLRLVQYASCRGLEGWTVFLDGLDTAWKSQKEVSARQINTQLPGVVSDPDSVRKEAWRFCLMPLSRPIDTLVIGISDPESELGKTILKVAAQLPDIVEVVR
jgi:hypothetical protein